MELWSKEHFDHMRPVMQKLADAGQKVITATIMNRPWNGQTEDAYGPMVTKTLKAAAVCVSTNWWRASRITRRCAF